MANDLNLHRCITKMPHAKRECYERTRLYFLVYLVDHHCSLVYGKPPMTREFLTLKSPRAFLESKLCISEDDRLISEIELWSIGSRVFDMFGADTEAIIANDRIAELDSLSRSYDLCRSAGFGAVTMDDIPGDFSEQLFDLHFHCAKLYLFSHTFRGSSQKSARPSTSSQRMEKLERCGIESALAIVRSVICRSDINGSLEMLPSYFGTMIAFASIFLMKAWGRESTMRYVDKNEISTALSRLVEVYQTASVRVQPRHPLCSVAKSLRIAINEYCQQHNTGQFGVGYIPQGLLDNSMFSFDGTGGNSSIMDFIGGYNNLLTSPHGFCGNIPNLQNI